MEKLKEKLLSGQEESVKAVRWVGGSILVGRYRCHHNGRCRHHIVEVINYSHKTKIPYDYPLQRSHSQDL